MQSLSRPTFRDEIGNFLVFIKDSLYRSKSLFLVTCRPIFSEGPKKGPGLIQALID
jgi:hypothetical protein